MVRKKAKSSKTRRSKTMAEPLIRKRTVSPQRRERNASHGRMNRIIRDGSPNGLSPEHGELSILLGDGVSAANVVTALLKFLKEVTENGIIVGYEEDNILIERIDGTVEKVPMQ